MKLTKEQKEQQNKELFGTCAPSDHAQGDVVQYIDGAELSQGEIIHTRAAGPVASGKMLRAGHIVESGRGWPKYVPVRDVVE